MFNKNKSYELHSLTSKADPDSVSRQGIATLRRNSGKLRPTTTPIDTSSGSNASRSLRNPGGLPGGSNKSLIIETPKGRSASDISKPHDWKGQRLTRSGEVMNERIHGSRIVGVYDPATDTVTPTARTVNKRRKQAGATRQKLAGLGASVAGLKILE